MLVVTVLCAIGAVAVVTLGWRRKLAEVAILGSLLLAVSVLPLAHGLTLPGVLYGPNAATLVAALAGAPLGVLIAFPLILPDLPASRTLAAHWRLWSVATMFLSVGFATTLLAAPDVLPPPRVGQPVTDLLILVALAGTLTLSMRHLRLFRIGNRKSSLVASAAFVYLGLSTLVFLTDKPFSITWWGAHVVDAVGVFGVIFGIAVAHHRDRSLAATLAPVVNRDPLVALELGLTPVVHEFVAALERKDSQTRDHVVRVGEMAMRVGARAGLSAELLRSVGLAGLLHDIGKLLTPDEILKKPAGLTEEEFETIKEHTVVGAELMASSPLLAGAAGLVRWHHERWDGGGYPDGLRGDQIPLEAAIISACDAWDAMSCNRHYRAALSAPQAREILLEGAGSQWNSRCVQLTVEVIDEGNLDTPIFDQVGRDMVAADLREDDAPLVCADAIPASARSASMAGSQLAEA